MNVREYWTVLREDKWLVGSVLVVCVAIAAAVALLLPRTYTSTAIFYVASPQSASSSTDSYAGSQLSTERVKSYSELLTGPRVAADASALLGGNPSAADIQKAVSADSVAETVVLNLGVTESTPQDAQLVGTAVATSFTRLVNSIESTGQPVNRPIVSTELIYPPTLPTFPAGPGTTMLLAAGLLAGIVLGVGAALGRRAMRRAVDTPEALETALEAPVLTALPGLPRRPDRPALLLEPAPGRRGRRAARARDRAAAVRRLRTAVLASAGGRRCLVVSGVRADQGTTTVAVDLAVALALAGESVLLVDADLRRPALAGRLDLDGARGLATVLDGAGWDGAVQRWTTGGLDVLPAGPVLDRPGEAWGTTAASSALRSLRESYTWVLLDASPVASSPESVDLARLADGVVLVARRGSARPEDLDAAAAGLRTVGAPVIGSVFTFAVDVPAAPVEAPRALPPGRSAAASTDGDSPSAVETTTAPGPVEAAETTTAEAAVAEPAAAVPTAAEPTAAEPTAAEPAAAPAAAEPAVAPEPAVAAAAASPRSRSVRQNASDLTRSAAQKSISDDAPTPGTAASTSASDADAPSTPKRRTRKTAEPAAEVSATDTAARPATRTRKTRATQTPANPAPDAATTTPAARDTASTDATTPGDATSSTTGETTAPATKPARKPRATRRTAVTTPTETAPTTEAAPTTAASTATAGTPDITTTPAPHTPNGISTNGTSAHEASAHDSTPNGTTPPAPAVPSEAPVVAESAASDDSAAPEATVASEDTAAPEATVASEDTPTDPSSGPKAPRTRRATRTTSRTAAPTDATTTVEGTDKPAARTRTTRTRTATNGHTPRPEAAETGTRPTRTRSASRTTPTSTPTSGS